MAVESNTNQMVRPQALASGGFEVFVPICLGNVGPKIYMFWFPGMSEQHHVLGIIMVLSPSSRGSSAYLMINIKG